MKTVALSKGELHTKSTYQEYLNNTKELTVLVELVNGVYSILGIFKDHITTKCHELVHYYELLSRKPLKLPHCTKIHTILEADYSVHIYQKTSFPVKKWRGINLSAYDNGVLNAQDGQTPSGLCTDDGKDTGGWFYTAEQSAGAPSRVGNTTTTYPSNIHAHTGSPLSELKTNDVHWATSYPLPSQIMAAINAGVNIFRVPFMPQFIPQIATGWAKEGFGTNSDMAKIYKPGNCLYFSFYMSTVKFILDYAKTGHKPGIIANKTSWTIKDVKVIIDCHSYMRWAPMNILATSTALDGPPNRRYSMDRNTDLRCPYTLNVSDSSNGGYISTNTDSPTIKDILGDPSGWSSDNKNSINWSDISGNPPEDWDITKRNISAHICKGATNQFTGYNKDSNKWDMIDLPKSFCQSNDKATNKCYGGPTKTVLGINCLPMLWYKLLHTKFYPCNSETCIPPSLTPAPTPAPPGPTGCVALGCHPSDICCHGDCVDGFCTSPTPAPGDACENITDNIQNGDYMTLLDFIKHKDYSGNIWLDLMNEPNQVNTRDLGTAYGKVLKVLHAHGVTNKLLIEGNYWSGMHAQIFPGESSAQGWTWKEDTPPTYNDISGSLHSYRGRNFEPSWNVGTNNTNVNAYLTDISKSPAELLYQSMSAEYNNGSGSGNTKRPSFDKLKWALNLHQYMDVNSTGGHGCYSAEQPVIKDVSAMKVFTRFNAIEAWSHARDISLIVTEFGAQLYTDGSYAPDKTYFANKKEGGDSDGNSIVYSAGCEQKTNLFLQMMEQSDQVMGWTMWRATPPVSYAQFNTTASMIAKSTDINKPSNYGSPVYGWSNGIVWKTDENDNPKDGYKFLQNSAQFSKPFTSLVPLTSPDALKINMPLIATGMLWDLSGSKVSKNFWDDFNKQSYPETSNTGSPNFNEHSTYTHKNIGYKQ